VVVALPSNLFNCKFNVNDGRREKQKRLVMRPCAKEGHNDTSGSNSWMGVTWDWSNVCPCYLVCISV